MKILFFILVMTLMSFAACSQSTNLTNSTIYPLGDRSSTQKRIENIKKSTVKVLIDKSKSGTGFFISSDGYVLTNWHVLFNERTRIDKTGKILNNFEIVNYKNDTLPVSIEINLSDENNIIKSTIWDVCILKTIVKINTLFLKIGPFSNAYEGCSVYTCGYPLDLNEPFISIGIISTFFTQQFDNGKLHLERKAAWLDMTTNKGNSGGPLIMLGDQPENDLVIGITSFITTPYANILEELNQYITQMEQSGGVSLMGIDFLQYAKLINTTVNSNSVGISGCISLDGIYGDIKPLNK